MEKGKETRAFEITTSPRIMKRIERFLALLHYNSSFGHSAMFGMSLDGDGSEKAEVKGISKSLSFEVDAIGGVGYDIEIACDNCYTGNFFDDRRQTPWYTGPSANLYKAGEVVKTVPGKDYDFEESC